MDVCGVDVLEAPRGVEAIQDRGSPMSSEHPARRPWILCAGALVAAAGVALSACRKQQSGPTPQTAILLREAKGSDEEARRTAIRTMMLSKNKDVQYVIPVLIEALEHKDRWTSTHAAQALEYITGREDIPRKRASWQTWWTENGDLFKKDEKAIDEVLRKEKAELLNNQGFRYLRMGMFRAAARQFESALGHLPEATYFNNLGLANYYLGHFEKAMNMFDQAWQKNKKFGLAVMNMARVYEVLGDYDRAIKAYQEAIRIDDGKSRETQRPMGVNWAAHLRLARVYLKRAINLDALLPRPQHPALSLGYPGPQTIGVEPGDPEPVLSEAAKRRLQDLGLAATEDELHRYYQDEALEHAQANNTFLLELAISECELAATMRPDIPEIYVTQSLACYGAGQYYRAWQAVEKVHQLGFDWTDPDFIVRLLRERKQMEKDFVEPRWVTEFLHKTGARLDPNKRLRGMNGVPAGYQSGRDYENK